MAGVTEWFPGWAGRLRAPRSHDVEFRLGLERTLHDEVAVSLSAMVVQLDLLAGTTCPDPALAARIDVARSAICDAVEEVRRLGRVLFSPVLRGGGMANAVRAAAEHGELQLRLDLPDHDFDLAAQKRIGLLVVDRLHALRPNTRVRVRVRGRRFVRVSIIERPPGRRERRYWAVMTCG
ncbi:histidine kinase [Actinophytocola xanthii]|uniref:Signal transduction histidine kinase subgroup 3 dimerisation and phosphoacceptor domain-containing protein n=1 Tax=Actinophytocola xanthii TaxID=1912961 RepID=A0A1Q8CTF0_9PSEU|nr:histidine kinase dimerization/phosphoacceptor domain-containing protein [Actinophytocola xanthii]OLF17645.1 hypothetical protein BU204_10535 [Actinophytocola xanthii]